MFPQELNKILRLITKGTMFNSNAMKHWVSLTRIVEK